ncbi:MAG: BlaI/MecI/CopY family transcriptional regulator [Prevotellaceae bacterium]|jgi:predicted transcriptional regulator|nr:BlaI/MecI/CopY family transcriptional regulator [Prevotellaceae bacterium]
MKLSTAEEQLMEIIWKHEKVFMKDIIDNYPEPKPAVTTIATFLKRMQNKGVISYNLFGNSRQYYSLINKEDYFTNHVNQIIKDFFDNSTIQFASFFTTAGNLSTKELEDLKKIIEKEIKRKTQ